MKSFLISDKIFVEDKLPFSTTLCDFCGQKRKNFLASFTSHQVHGATTFGCFFQIKSCEESLEDLFPPEDIVYMSPDSPNILQEISPKKIYVIGGLVDGTPKIRASLLRAQAIGCQTARLPINEFMTRVTPHGYNTILTLNQVYEILLRFHESNCWEEALKACVPQRKGFKLNQELEPPTNENLSVKTETADELEKMIKSED